MGANMKTQYKESDIPLEQFPCARAVRFSLSRFESGCEEACFIQPTLSEDGSVISFKWPDGVIPYRIDESLITHPILITSIIQAIDQYHKETVIKFIEYQENKGIKDWLLFKFDPEITDSDVGRVGGMQDIRISPNARKGNVMHEIMHVLGFYHEHSRVDREKFISVNPESSSTAMTENISIEGCPLGKYDPDSIMHYPIDGKILKAKKDLAKRMGQRERFSDGDLKAIKYLYSGPCCTYNAFGEECFMQNYYECITCWGRGADYGVCEFCRDDCHSGHETIFHDISENSDGFVCDCGRNRHAISVCSSLISREKPVKQMLYRCYDCFEVADHEKTNGYTSMVCKACFERCHKDHRYQTFGVGFGFCNCGKTHCKILCKAIKQLR